MNIYEEAIKTFGMQHQEWKIVEELLELATAIAQCRTKPDECDYDRIIEEIADVDIMIAQLEAMMRMNGYEDLDARIVDREIAKTDRLAKLIEEEKARQ